MALVNELLGPELAKEAVLELNASDDRGIDVVRNRIKAFATKKVNLPPGRHKMIIFDEADSMTAGAQQALRRIMELHSTTTRFALACNTSSKIIEPIQSRCAILRFSRLKDEEVVERLMDIAKAENVEITPEGFCALLFVADGDMRQAINSLQATYSGFGSPVTAEKIFRVCDQPHPEAIRRVLVDGCMKGDLDLALTGLEHLWSLGYAAVDLILTFFRVARGLEHPVIPEALQLEYIRVVGLTHVNIVQGCPTKLQLAGMLAELCAMTYEEPTRSLLPAPPSAGKCSIELL